MTAPRQPRQWNAGDHEPEDCPVLRDHAPGAGFIWETPIQREGIWGNEYGQWMPWAKVLEHYGPLTEVLPETPEPPAKIFAPWNSETALTLIDFQQVGHLHPFTCPRDHGGQFPLVANNGGWFCPADKCDYTQNWAWAFMADRSAWPDSPIWPIPAPQSSPTPLLPLSAPVETEGGEGGDTEALSPQAETELKLWNLLDKAEQEYLASDEPCDRKSALVRAILAEGWRPPLPPEGAEIGDDVIVVFAGRPVEGRPLPVKVGWEGDQFVELPPDFAVPPLPADEVEWQWGCGSSIDDIFSLDEATAREHAASTGVLRKRRKAGPWVAVPVEPKETTQ